MALLEPSYFKKLFQPFSGKRIGFIPLDGNVGDYLNHRATCLFFEYFDIDYEIVSPIRMRDRALDFDELVVSGGGNMGGKFYERPYNMRRALLNLNIPITIFPQSFIQNQEDVSPYKKVYVRENASLELNPRFELAPDLALGYRGRVPRRKAKLETGVFMRVDVEQYVDDRSLSLGDPAWLSATVPELFDLAAAFEHIVTDRLHFGIAALLLGRKVTLLPNSYFKNRAFYQTWLVNLCSWADDLSGIEYDRPGVEQKLYQRLAGAPSEILPWSAVPRKECGYFVESRHSEFLLIHADGRNKSSLQCNETAQMVWQLSDGARTVKSITRLLVDAFPGMRLTVTRDVQGALGRFAAHGSMTIDHTKPAPAPEDSARRPARGRPGGKRSRRKMRLVVNRPTVHEGKYRCSASLDGLELWFAAEVRHQNAVTSRADPFVLASLMIAMRGGASLNVDGAPVSMGLLENLEELQRAWSRWRDCYQPVDIEATPLTQRGTDDKPALAVFSGGVDSSYTLYKHLVNPDRRWRPNIEAALMIQGFDSAPEDEQKFKHSFNNGKRLLRGLPVELIAVQTNLKRHLPAWLDVHGMVLGAVLTLFSRRYGAGIIASTLPYVMIQPLGSNPITDPLMGSRDFKIIHHGSDASRLDKIRALADWPPVYDHLRVCWRSTSADELNCGRCLSCVLAALSFRCFGRTPSCLPVSMQPEDVMCVLDRSKPGRLDWFEMKCIVQEVEARGLEDAPWLVPIMNHLAGLSSDERN